MAACHQQPAGAVARDRAVVERVGKQRLVGLAGKLGLVHSPIKIPQIAGKVEGQVFSLSHYLNMAVHNFERGLVVDGVDRQAVLFGLVPEIVFRGARMERVIEVTADAERDQAQGRDVSAGFHAVRRVGFGRAKN